VTRIIGLSSLLRLKATVNIRDIRHISRFIDSKRANIIASHFRVESIEP